MPLPVMLSAGSTGIISAGFVEQHSHQTIIVMIRRDEKLIIPKGDQMLMEGDSLVLYTQQHLPDDRTIRI